MVVLTGLGQPVQVAANSRLREAVASPGLAALLSASVTIFVLAITTTFGLLGSGHFSGLRTAPWWAWAGGACGALSILAGIVALPQTSAAIVITAAVFGQMLASLIVDHFGWLGVQVYRINTPRIIGALLVLVGAVLIQRR